MATPQNITERLQLAGKLRSVREAVAEQAASEFLERHPDWVRRYGEKAHNSGVEDARLHLNFLAGAIESGSPHAFADYGRWAARMLSSRGIEPRFLAENFDQIGRAALARLPALEPWIRPCIDSARSACLEPAPAPEDERPGGELSVIQKGFLEAILGGRRRSAPNLLIEAFQAGHSILDIYVRVVQESLYEVGRRWEANQISVAQEHRATAITQYAIAQLYPHIPPAEEARGLVLLTGVQGERHQLGANLVADALEADGWDVIFLGADTPTESILDAVRTQRPDVLGVSITMLFNVPVLVRLVEKVREAHPDLTVAAGGAAIRMAPSLCEELGVHDTGPDVRAAVQLFRSLEKNLAGRRS